ncbi:MAG: enoyl-CoA hydratase-related protein [Candidatus Eisenbacteria bacterium]
MEPKLRIRERGPIREIRLHRPEVHNAFDEQLIAELSDAFGTVRSDVESGQDIRAVVLSGEGKSFCAGADLHYMKSIASYGESENRADAERLARMFLAVRSCPVYVVAKVQGAALGGGTGLVAAADRAVAAVSTKFGFTEVRLGIVPAVISPFVLERIGAAHGRALFPTGERFGTEDALRIGLVDQIVPDDGLDEAVDRILSAVLAAGPGASRDAKQLATEVGAALPLPMDADTPVFQMTAARIARLRGAPEGQEGMAAFLEKRRPSWTTDLPEPN